MTYSERIRELEEAIDACVKMREQLPIDATISERDLRHHLIGLKEGYALGHSEAKTEIGIDGLRKEWMHEHEEMIIQRTDNAALKVKKRFWN